MKFLSKIQLLSTGLKFQKNLTLRQGFNFNYQAAGLTTKSLGHSVTFITENDSEAQKLGNAPDLSKFSSDGKPLTVLVTWVHAKDSGVKSYVKFYTDLGFDVLKVRINAYELAFPWNIDTVVTKQLLPALLTSTHENKFIHGFSVGGCVYSQMVKQFYKDPVTYADVMRSIRCQIFDSFTDLTGAKEGISTSVFPSSPPLQKVVRKFLDFYLDNFPKSMDFLTKSRHNLYTSPLKVPALFLYSKADKIGTYEASKSLQEAWKNLGVSCTEKVWEDSPHVLHMKVHPEEYQHLVKQFLISNELLNTLTSRETSSLDKKWSQPVSQSQVPSSGISNTNVVFFSKKNL